MALSRIRLSIALQVNSSLKVQKNDDDDDDDQNELRNTIKMQIKLFCEVYSKNQTKNYITLTLNYYKLYIVNCKWKRVESKESIEIERLKLSIELTRVLVAFKWERRALTVMSWMQSSRWPSESDGPEVGQRRWWRRFVAVHWLQLSGGQLELYAIGLTSRKMAKPCRTRRKTNRISKVTTNAKEEQEKGCKEKRNKKIEYRISKGCVRRLI